MKTPEKPTEEVMDTIAAECDAFAEELGPLVRRALETKTGVGVAMALLKLAAQTLFHDGDEDPKSFQNWARAAFNNVAKHHGKDA